jgi:hypothetical protein
MTLLMLLLPSWMLILFMLSSLSLWSRSLRAQDAAAP